MEENKPDPISDPSNWKFNIFYFNRSDKRLLAPSRLKATGGYVINYANPLSVIAGIAIVCGAILLLKTLKV